MSETNNGGPAFPFGQVSEATGQLVNGFGSEGMTLRDYFAAKAMQSILSLGSGYDYQSRNKPKECADDAYAMADAMLRAREAS